MDLDPACCLLYKTADRLWLSYHTVSAEDMRQAARWTQEEILNMGEPYNRPGGMDAVVCLHK